MKSDSSYTVVTSKTIVGQVATFIEALHLTYDEVLSKIPYRTLLLMLKDKQHATTGDVYEEVDEETFFKGNNPINKNQ